MSEVQEPPYIKVCVTDTAYDTAMCGGFTSEKKKEFLALWKFTIEKAQELRALASKLSMEKQREDFNPCQSCDCWDGDLGGCTMPPDDTFFACPLYAEPRYNPP